ncbi:MAG TPA: hypothetical protein VM012_14790 [Flavitalea sp.]|nr:hypothetical protein [Flavitalea sp.]
MVPSLRKHFNDEFSVDQYHAFLLELNRKYPGALQFRVAETPIFVPPDFKKKLIDACESIVDFITEPDFKKLTDRSIPVNENVPGENDHAHMIAFDFGVCINDKNELEPQLIEMQGFPTLYGFQVYYPEVLGKYFPVPQNFSHYLGDYNKEIYLADLKSVILGKHAVENVILLEIKPHEQKTRIDFYCTEDYLGIQPVCITELKKEGKKLFYIRDGKKTAIERIYNRIIFDDLNSQRKTLGDFVDITKELEVEWVPHPNWFYRISKFTLPFIHHPYVPETFFLNEVKQLSADLGNYVLKPLFSFAGQGVVIDVTREDIDRIRDPQNWILQKKVQYADVIPTPDIPAKAEIRVMYLWKDGSSRPKPATNLARLSKGKMIGVRYNQDKEWVGGSVALFER